MAAWAPEGGTISIFQRFIYKHPWKDSLETKGSYCLLARCAEMQETPENCLPTRILFAVCQDLSTPQPYQVGTIMISQFVEGD